MSGKLLLNQWYAQIVDDLNRPIPKQDIIDGLPIRWAFHVWLTGGQWKFKEWREYLLSFNQRGYEMIKDIYTEPRFRLDVIHFLDFNRATTLAGFIRFYLKCQDEYAQLLKNNGIAQVPPKE